MLIYIIMWMKPELRLDKRVRHESFYVPSANPDRKPRSMDVRSEE